MPLIRKYILGTSCCCCCWCSQLYCSYDRKTNSHLILNTKAQVRSPRNIIKNNEKHDAVYFPRTREAKWELTDKRGGSSTTSCQTLDFYFHPRNLDSVLKLCAKCMFLWRQNMKNRSTFSFVYWEINIFYDLHIFRLFCNLTVKVRRFEASHFEF